MKKQSIQFLTLAILVGMSMEFLQGMPSGAPKQTPPPKPPKSGKLVFGTKKPGVAESIQPPTPENVATGDAPGFSLNPSTQKAPGIQLTPHILNTAKTNLKPTVINARTSTSTQKSLDQNTQPGLDLSDGPTVKKAPGFNSLILRQNRDKMLYFSQEPLTEMTPENIEILKTSSSLTDPLVNNIAKLYKDHGVRRSLNDDVIKDQSKIYVNEREEFFDEVINLLPEASGASLTPLEKTYLYELARGSASKSTCWLNKYEPKFNNDQFKTWHSKAVTFIKDVKSGKRLTLEDALNIENNGKEVAPLTALTPEDVATQRKFEATLNTSPRNPTATQAQANPAQASKIDVGKAELQADGSTRILNPNVKARADRILLAKKKELEEADYGQKTSGKFVNKQGREISRNSAEFADYIIEENDGLLTLDNQGNILLRKKETTLPPQPGVGKVLSVAPPTNPIPATTAAPTNKQAPAKAPTTATPTTAAPAAKQGPAQPTTTRRSATQAAIDKTKNLLSNTNQYTTTENINGKPVTRVETRSKPTKGKDGKVVDGKLLFAKTIAKDGSYTITNTQNRVTETNVVNPNGSKVTTEYNIILGKPTYSKTISRNGKDITKTMLDNEGRPTDIYEQKNGKITSKQVNIYNPDGSRINKTTTNGKTKETKYDSNNKPGVYTITNAKGKIIESATAPDNKGKRRVTTAGYITGSITKIVSDPNFAA